MPTLVGLSPELLEGGNKKGGWGGKTLTPSALCSGRPVYLSPLYELHPGCSTLIGYILSAKLPCACADSDCPVQYARVDSDCPVQCARIDLDCPVQCARMPNAVYASIGSDCPAQCTRIASDCLAQCTRIASDCPAQCASIDSDCPVQCDLLSLG